VDLLKDFLESLRHPEGLIRAVGYPGLFAIVFAESGRSYSRRPACLPKPLCVIAAISGDAVGYAFGKQAGRRLYDRPDSRFFKRKHLLAAELFYEKHGGKTIVIARFLPIVRTFAPIVAGASNMQYRRFAVFNVLGGVLWGAGLTIGGYVLGEAIPDIDKYLLPIIALIVVLSALPTIIHVLHANRAQIRARLRRQRNATDPSPSPAANREGG
jgi:membrane-associated protein